jgi:hypothetical protein
MTNVIGHGYNFVIVIIFRVPDCLMAPLTAFVMCDDQIWSQMFLCFGHNLPLTAFASDMTADVAVTSLMTWQLTSSFWNRHRRQVYIVIE